MTKRFFAAHHEGRIFFRASDTRAYQSLRFESETNWGMVGKPGPIPVREITKTEYTALVARKLAAGGGNAPTQSWVDADA